MSSGIGGGGGETRGLSSLRHSSGYAVVIYIIYFRFWIDSTIEIVSEEFPSKMHPPFLRFLVTLYLPSERFASSYATMYKYGLPCSSRAIPPTPFDSAYPTEEGVNEGGAGACRDRPESRIAFHYDESIPGRSRGRRQTHHRVPLAGMHSNG